MISTRISEEPIKLIATQDNITAYYGHSCATNGVDNSDLSIIQIKEGVWLIKYKIISSDGYTPNRGSL